MPASPGVFVFEGNVGVGGEQKKRRRGWGHSKLSCEFITSHTNMTLAVCVWRGLRASIPLTRDSRSQAFPIFWVDLLLACTFVTCVTAL